MFSQYKIVRLTAPIFHPSVKELTAYAAAGLSVTVVDAEDPDAMIPLVCDADVVVVNHHLFFADVMLKDDGMGELLPACNTVIFDEAHQLPEVAGLFFGEAIGTGQLLDLARH